MKKIDCVTLDTLEKGTEYRPTHGQKYESPTAGPFSLRTVTPALVIEHDNLVRAYSDEPQGAAPEWKPLPVHELLPLRILVITEEGSGIDFKEVEADLLWQVVTDFFYLANPRKKKPEKS